MSEQQRSKLDELILTLQQQRDELKLKLHLGKQELKDEWDVLEGKLQQLSDKSQPLREASGETAEDVWTSLKLVGEEIAAGFQRIRKSL